VKAIAFYTQKGGTGKTTLSGNVAFELGAYKKTLMIDGDPQGNLTGWYVTDPIDFDLADVMLGRCSAEQAIIQLREGLFLLPTIAIDGELKGWSETQLAGKPFAFQDLRDSIEALGFDYIVFDLGPGMSMLEKSILAICDEIVGVVGAEAFSADGLEIFENELDKLKKDRRATFVTERLVINRVNRSYSLHNAYIEQFSSLPYGMYQIGQSTGISDCVPAHQSIFEFDPGNRWTSEFQRLAKEIHRGRVNTK
jgi:cellulose biosynthesis protein BcsQ